MPTHNLLLIPGDGIGPEVMAEVKKLIAWMNAHRMGTFATEEGLCGGCAYDAHGVAITDEMVATAPRIGEAAHRILSGIRLGETVAASMGSSARLYPREDCTAVFASLANLGAFIAPDSIRS